MRKIKFILSKLKVAQLKNKKVIKVNKGQVNTLILNFLWKKGLICGFTNINNLEYKIFLKYSVKGKPLLETLIFLNNPITVQDLKTLNVIEKNSNYFILNDKGIFFHQECLNKGCGGVLFAKI